LNDSKKVLEEYNCDVCDYTTSVKSNFTKHLLTGKHLYKSDTKKVSKHHTKYNCICGKSFKYDSGYYRHKKMCHSNKDKKYTENNVNITPELVIELIKNNNEFKNIIVEQNTTIMEQNNTINNLVKNGINNTTNNNITNNNNKTFNLQVFLNETCKDAMNISDFVNSIQLGLSDFERIGEVGYAQGISDIITSNLKALDITQRPVHCTDKKREIMYVKDQDVWEKEDENKTKIKKMIKRIENKNIQAIPQFQKKYPNFSNSKSRESDKFHKTIIEAMGGPGGSEGKEGKIIRNISKHVTIDK
jgi:Txe/YoeB family toxin of Txe-Axe toxin-antitoxin module